MTRAQAKLQRWIDLIAVLLTHRYGVTFERLRTDVPGYATGGKRESVARTFERDKDELRALGIPIETLEPTVEEEGHQRYRIDPREVYLPYLFVAGGMLGSQRTDVRRMRAGYRSVPSLSFEPNEYAALVNGAKRAGELDDLTITGDATAALRKLAFDMPVDSVLGSTTETVLVRNEPATADRLRPLGNALLRLKRVTFTYRSMTSDVTSQRTAEPYGLFFLSNHWYLAARDIATDQLRNFRVSRMSDVAVNVKQPQSKDFTIRNEFRLAAHAVDRKAWEIGDGDATDMVVEFRGNSGPTVAALRLGSPGNGPRLRVFSVRRRDAFCRWILSFAGEAVPLSPPELVQEYHALVRAAFDVYAEPT
ncbi:MAG: helix-turn-helix transcriptional regulator [Gemmatimonadaceae bacterium]